MKNLLNDIEQAVGSSMRRHSDFVWLSDRIFARLRVYVSHTTLKRLWGYIDEGVQPRESTLDVLARFIGYADYQAYCRRGCEQTESNPVMSRKLTPEADLTAGDTVVLSWLPDRECTVVYLGSGKFKVEKSVNTRLTPGTTFDCSLVVEGEPLYLNNVDIGGKALTAYVCGKKNGIRWEVIPANPTH